MHIPVNYLGPVLKHAAYRFGMVMSFTLLTSLAPPAVNAAWQQPDTLRLIEDLHFNILTLQQELNDVTFALEECRSAPAHEAMVPGNTVEAMPGITENEEEEKNTAQAGYLPTEEEIIQQEAMHQQQLQKLQEETDNLVLAHQATKDEKQQLYDENIRLSGKVQNLEASAAYNAEERLHLMEENQRLQRENNALQKENQAFMQELALAEKKQTYFSAQRDQWQNDSLRYVSDLDSLARVIVQWENLRAADESLMEDKGRTIQEKSAILEEMEKTLAQLKNELQQKEEDISRLENRLEDTKQALQQKEEENEALQQLREEDKEDPVNVR